MQRLAVILGVLFLVRPAAARGDSPLEKRPNVIFIVVDDLGCRLHCYGDPDAKSPNIDRLAARGVRFDRAYCQYPVCNASRTSFLTGKRPDTTGVIENKDPFRTKMPDVVTLPELCRSRGYFTASLGKVIHQGLNARGNRAFFEDAKSWDDCRGFVATPTGLRGEGRNLTNGQIPACHWLAAEGTDEDQPDGQIAAEAIKIITTNRKNPFFLGLGFMKPHDPFNAPKRYFDLYPPDQVRLHRDPADRSAEAPWAIPKGQAFAGFTDRERRELKRAYLAGLSFMDAQLGKVLDALDREKLWESTIVVFMGDHGYHLGEHNWWNKVTVFELCARAPLIVWAPETQGMGRAASGLVEFLDIYPTLNDLCRLDAPPGLEGKSFFDLLEDPSLPGKNAAYTQVFRGPRTGRSVRTDRWRYTEWDGGKLGTELYDHAVDPLEYHNLAADPAHKATVADLKKIILPPAP